jgi:hypothetical protein
MAGRGNVLFCVEHVELEWTRLYHPVVMARRASRSIHPAWVIALAVWMVVVLAGGYLVIKKLNNHYRAVEPLDVVAYLDNSDSLRGNTYKLSGQVWNSLAWSPRWGRLFSIEITSSPGAGTMVPVLIPPEYNHVNVQKGQLFQFRIEVDEHGILHVKDLSKA